MIFLDSALFHASDSTTQHLVLAPRSHHLLSNDQRAVRTTLESLVKRIMDVDPSTVGKRRTKSFEEVCKLLEDLGGGYASAIATELEKCQVIELARDGQVETLQGM